MSSETRFGIQTLDIVLCICFRLVKSVSRWGMKKLVKWTLSELM